MTENIQKEIAAKLASRIQAWKQTGYRRSPEVEAADYVEMVISEYEASNRSKTGIENPCIVPIINAARKTFEEWYPTAEILSSRKSISWQAWQGAMAYCNRRCISKVEAYKIFLKGMRGNRKGKLNEGVRRGILRGFQALYDASLPFKEDI